MTVRANALAESVNGLYKAEVIHRRSWRSLEQVELATAEWVDWWNHRRLHSAIDSLPPAEYEARYSAGNFGSIRYPFFKARVDAYARLSDRPHEDQIEYEDENPEVRQLFEAEVAKYRARHQASAGTTAR